MSGVATKTTLLIKEIVARCISSEMARLERFELPTNWFEVLKVKLYIYIYQQLAILVDH